MCFVFVVGGSVCAFILPHFSMVDLLVRSRYIGGGFIICACVEKYICIFHLDMLTCMHYFGRYFIFHSVFYAFA